jgi:hypothetical protein
LAIGGAALAGCDRDSNTSRNGGTGTGDATNHTATGMPGAGSTASGASGTVDRVGTPTTRPANAPGAAPGAADTPSGTGSGSGSSGAGGTGVGSTGGPGTGGGSGSAGTSNSNR